MEPQGSLSMLGGNVELQLSQETYRIHIYREIQKKTKHNTAQQPKVELNTSNLLFYFPLAESTPKQKDWLFCLLGNAGVIHRHPDPEESTQSCISLRLAVAWCYTNRKMYIKKRKSIYILGVD